MENKMTVQNNMTFVAARNLLIKTAQELTEARNRVKKLEQLFAEEIQKVADLLKESKALETEIEKLRNQNEYLRQCQKNPDKEKTPIYDRGASSAMVVHGEIRPHEASGY